MNDQPKNISKVKKSLMVLNRLKANSPSEQLKTTHNNATLNYHPDIDRDLKKLQCQLLSNEDFMLSNADFHVKNLLTGFLEAVDEEDKTKIVESKIKTIKESQFEFEKNKLVDVLEEENSWGRSKTKMLGLKQQPNKMVSSKNIKMHMSSNALGALLRPPSQKKQEITNEKTNTEMRYKRVDNCSKNAKATGNKTQVPETSPTHLVNSNNSRTRIQFASNQIFEIPGIKGKDKNKRIDPKKRSMNKSSKNLSKVINQTVVMPEENIHDRRRISIPSATHKEIATYVENSLKKLKTQCPTFKQLSTKDKQSQIKQIAEDDEGFTRSRTYNRKVTTQKAKEEVEDADNMTISYRRFRTKNENVTDFVKCLMIKEIDILNLQGLSQLNKRKLSQICNQLKQNIVNDEDTIGTVNKESANMKASTLEGNFLLQSVTTVVSEEKHRNISRKGYVYDSLDDEEIEDEVEGVFYINPGSFGFLIYETVIFISIGYVVLYMPYSLAHDFNIGRDSSLAKNIIDFLIDGLFFFDVFIRFFVAYHNFDEVLIKKNEDIALHYLSTLFLCDLTAAIPINTILYLTHYSSFTRNDFPNYYNTNTKQTVQLISIIPIVKIFKLFKWNTMSLIAQSFFLEFNHFIRWSKVYLSLILLLISIHLLSCIFIFLGQIDYPNWIIKQKLDTSSFGTIYIASVYYILSSVFTIGYGDITSVSRPERLYNLFLLIVGIMVYSWALSSISTYIQTSDAKTIEFQNKCEILEEIKITHEKMPYELFDKIQRFLRYKVKNEKKDKNVIFDSLPIVLRNNLIQEMYKPIIDNFIFFKNFKNPDFIVRVLLAFKPIMGLKNDILVKEGDYIEEIIFVKRGNLALEIPLPIIVNPESLKRSRITLTKTYSKNIKGAYTFNNNVNDNTLSKNIYSLDDPNLRKDNERPKPKGTFSLEDMKTKTLLPKETAIATRTYVKILEIRKNEHFGDILMFLNKRSPLSVKVKSKYVEMFFLKKTDAIEISMNYPKIWRAINKKSLFNMEQIDRLIDKALKLFFISNEGQKNLSQTQAPQFIETMIAQSLNENMKSSEYPRTQEEIIKLLNEKNEKCELRSIPSDFRSIIIEESNDYERSSIIGTSQPKEQRELGLLSEKNFQTEKNGQEKDANGSDTHSTARMNINNKSILLTEREDLSNKSIIKQTQETLTPFRYSDINTEIYPNEELMNFASYTTSLNVNDRFLPSNSGITINSLSSSIIQGDNNKKAHQPCNNAIEKEDSNRSNDDKSEIPFANRFHKKNDEDDYTRQMKTIKIDSSELFPRRTSLRKTVHKSVIKLCPVMENNNCNIAKVGSFRLSFCVNTSFTIHSDYANVNAMNSYNISATKGLLSAIFSLNIEEIEKALEKCSFAGSLNKYLRRSSLSLTDVSIRKRTVNHGGTVLQYTPAHNNDTFIVPNEDIKLTLSDRLHKKKMTRAKSISINSIQNNSLLIQREFQQESPRDQKKTLSKFNKKFLNKSPTFSNIANRRSPNIQQVATMNAFPNLENPPDKSQLMSPSKKMMMGSLKHVKTLAAPKKNLLNVISENIVKNSQNLNNPELFYSEYFQKIMDEKNDLKEQENLVKRLEDTEKFLFDSVRKPDHNGTNVNCNNNT